MPPRLSDPSDAHPVGADGTDVTPPATASWRSAWWVAGISFLVLLLGAWRPTWSIDESATVVVVRQGWTDTWVAAGRDIALGPYYLALRPLAGLGTTELWLRLPSVLAATLAVVALGLLVRRAAGTALGLTAGGVLLLALPATSRFGQDARPYALALAACVVAALAWWSWLVDGRRRYAVGLSVALVLAGLAHAYSLLMIGVLVLTAALAPLRARRRDVVATAVPSAVAVAVLAPLLLLQSARAHGSPDPAPATLSHILATWVKFATAGSSRADIVLAVLLVLVSGVGVVTYLRRPGPVGTLAVLGTVWLVLPPVALVVLQVVAHKPGIVPRYWFFALPGLAVCVALGLAVLAARRRALGIGALAALVLLALPGQLRVRSVDGHGGVRYDLLLRALALPETASMPLVIRSWNYRSLLARDPGLSPGRTPLLALDGSTPDVVHPRVQGGGTGAYERLVARNRTVVAYQSRVPVASGAANRVGIERDFPALAVRCDWFGDLLEVLSQDDADLPSLARQGIAHDLEALDPAAVTCTAYPAGTSSTLPVAWSGSG